MSPDSRSSDSNVLCNEFYAFVECSCVRLLADTTTTSGVSKTAVTHATLPPIYRSSTHDG